MITIHDCPFCGHADVEIGEVGTCEYAVDCPECRAIGPIENDIMEAIGAWNTASRLKTPPDVLDLIIALEIAERFMAGFEDDPTQDNIAGHLKVVRAAISTANGGTPCAA